VVAGRDAPVIAIERPRRMSREKRGSKDSEANGIKDCGLISYFLRGFHVTHFLPSSSELTIPNRVVSPFHHRAWRGLHRRVLTMAAMALTSCAAVCSSRLCRLPTAPPPHQLLPLMPRSDLGGHGGYVLYLEAGVARRSGLVGAAERRKSSTSTQLLATAPNAYTPALQLSALLACSAGPTVMTR
jgi:hypothetical protein